MINEVETNCGVISDSLNLAEVSKADTQKPMNSKTHLGEFEIYVLSAVLRCGDNAYGMLIRREIEKTTGRKVSIGAVHATLVRLENKGFLSSEMGGATSKRGGRAKRFYSISLEGRERLEQSVSALLRITNGVVAAVN